MKKKAATTQRAAVAKAQPADLVVLITEVRDLIQSARRRVASVVDTFQVMTNFEIGRRIVEHEQKGAKRAAYGVELLKELSVRLTEEFGRGFSEDNLALMRRFYAAFADRRPISETLFRKSDQIPFILSWSHYVELLGIKDPDERSFYEIESRQSNWNVRELKRQKASCLYEHLAFNCEFFRTNGAIYDSPGQLPRCDRHQHESALKGRHNCRYRWGWLDRVELGGSGRCHVVEISNIQHGIINFQVQTAIPAYPL